MEKNRLKLPRNKEVLLLINNFIFICIITHIGEDVITVTNLRKRIILEHGYEDIYISNKFYFNRGEILGFCSLENEKIINNITPTNKVIELKRNII